jgi:HAE1 family hydrophobic/amphiphilic exporter-1
MTTIVVFLPIVFMSADLRQMQGPMAITITYSLVASLFVALTLVPLLFLKLKIKPPEAQKKQDTLSLMYKWVLKEIMAYRYIAILVVAGLFVGSLYFFSKIDMNLYETEEENKFTIHVELPTGAKLEASDDRVEMVEQILNELPELESLSSKIEKWSSKIFVTLVPKEQRTRTKEEIIASLRPKFKDIQPAFIYFKESQAMAAKEIFVDLFGNDYAVLKELAMKVGGYIKSIPGLVDVKIRMREGRPEKIVILDRKRVSLSGFTISDVSENLHARLRGLVATTYHEKAKEIETIVRQEKSSFRDFTDIYNLKMRNNNGDFIQLSQMAEFGDDKGPSEIWRKNKKRFVQVSATREKVSLEKAADQILDVLKRNVDPPDNYYYEIGGDYNLMLKNKKELYYALIMTIILVYLVLGSLFESYSQPFIIMLSVPLSLIGVVIALKITKTTISTGVIMGIIMLAGIVVNNAIMLLDKINGLKDGNAEDYIVEGSVERLRPIMMTVTTTILGLLPLAIKGGEGAGLWKPLSVTVIGGLISSTMLVLFIVPCVYKSMERLK